MTDVVPFPHHRFGASPKDVDCLTAGALIVSATASATAGRTIDATFKVVHISLVTNVVAWQSFGHSD